MLNHMTDLFDNLTARISGNREIKAIRGGMLYIMPMVMIGSIMLTVLNLPIPAFQGLMNGLFGGHWREVALSVYNGTFGVLALLLLLSVSYAYGYEHRLVRRGEVSAAGVMLTSFMSFFAFNMESDVVITAENARSTGMFGAIVIALASVKLLLFFYEKGHSRFRLLAHDADALLLSSFKLLTPALLTAGMFALFRLFLQVTGMSGLIQTMYTAFFTAIGGMENKLIVAIFYILLIQILWFVGLHGTNLMEQPVHDLFVAATETNQALVAAGQAPTQILTKEFLDNFVFLGGCGATLGLLIALLFAAKRRNFSRMARYSLFPGLFNINEMMVYGLPIIFNPYYFIPFVVTPMVLATVTYLAVVTGAVPPTVDRVQWTIPILLSGYTATGGSVMAVLLQVVNLGIAALIYTPFVRLYERHQEKSDKEIFAKLTTEIDYVQNVQRPQMTSRSDEVGMLARALAAEIERTVTGKGEALYMAYQPKVNGEGCVIGAEALLRWRHPVYGVVSPVVILALADEIGRTTDLGNWVIETAFNERKRWYDLGYQNLCLSVNLSPAQLQEDGSLLETLTAHINRVKPMPACCFEIELTENAAIENSLAVRRKLRRIKEIGFSIAIDDFGMGHTSILYLRDFFVDVLKIDASLVGQIETDTQSQEIARSIFSLCEQIGVHALAEGVETAGQLEKLQALGCRYFQGYYFSCALDSASFIAYIEQHGIATEEPGYGGLV